MQLGEEPLVQFLQFLLDIAFHIFGGGQVVVADGDIAVGAALDIGDDLFRIPVPEHDPAHKGDESLDGEGRKPLLGTDEPRCGVLVKLPHLVELGALVAHLVGFQSSGVIGYLTDSRPVGCRHLSYPYIIVGVACTGSCLLAGSVDLVQVLGIDDETGCPVTVQTDVDVEAGIVGKLVVVGSDLVLAVVAVGIIPYHSGGHADIA